MTHSDALTLSWLNVLEHLTPEYLDRFANDLALRSDDAVRRARLAAADPARARLHRADAAFWDELVTVCHLLIPSLTLTPDDFEALRE